MSELQEISDCKVSMKLVNKFQFQLKWHSNGQIFYMNTYTHYPAHVAGNLATIPETINHI
jgi:hypothetical protein